MPSLSLRRLVPLSLAFATMVTIACSGDGAVAPIAEEAELEPVELSLASMDRGDAAPAATDRQVPTLQRLLHEAIARVRDDRGPEAARRMLASVRTLLEEAREARQAGDLRLAKRKLREANHQAARIVIRVFGPQVAERLNAAVATKLGELQARIAELEAAGADVTQLTRVATAVTSLHDGAERLIAAGAYPRALLLSAHALDLLRRAAAS